MAPSERTAHGEGEAANAAPAKARLAAVACLLLLGLHLAHSFAYAFLTDDAYISFRYVQNALAGEGLVFNPGERVEGYTNFLWVVQLIGLGGAGIGPEDGSLILSLLYSLGSFGAALAIARELVFARQAAIALPVCALVLATNRSYAIWTTGGLETRSCTFFMLAGTYGAIRFLLGSRGPASIALFAGGWACAALTRPDALLMGGVCGIVILAATRDIARLLLLAAATAFPVAAHFFWRKSYYGEWLPNTYVAKVGEPWWGMGAAYLGSFVVEYALWLLLPFAAWAAWRLPVRPARPAGFAFLAMMAAQALYQARIGGDHFEFRPFDFCWPLVAILCGVGAARWMYPRPRGAKLALRLAFALAAILYSSAIPVLHARDARAISSREQATFQPMPITDLGAYRLLPGAGLLVGLWNRWTGETIPHAVGVRAVEHDINARFLLGLYGPMEGLAATGDIPESAITKAGAVGIASYYLRIPVIDIFGLTDPVVARTPAVGRKRMMAHDHDPPPGYLAKRGVNFVEPRAWRQVPRDIADDPSYNIVDLSDGRFLTFLSPDPSWVERAFAGRIRRLGTAAP